MVTVSYKQDKQKRGLEAGSEQDSRVTSGSVNLNTKVVREQGNHRGIWSEGMIGTDLPFGISPQQLCGGCLVRAGEQPGDQGGGWLAQRRENKDGHGAMAVYMHTDIEHTQK